MSCTLSLFSSTFLLVFCLPIVESALTRSFIEIPTKSPDKYEDDEKPSKRPKSVFNQQCPQLLKFIYDRLSNIWRSWYTMLNYVKLATLLLEATLHIDDFILNFTFFCSSNRSSRSISRFYYQTPVSNEFNTIFRRCFSGSLVRGSRRKTHL